MVLLKNDGELLPLKAGQTVAVIGEMARSPRYQGAGSSLINPTQLDSAFDCLLDAGVSVLYAPGYNKTTDQPDEGLIRDACQTAKKADVVLLFLGLTESYEPRAMTGSICTSLRAIMRWRSVSEATKTLRSSFPAAHR